MRAPGGHRPRCLRLFRNSVVIVQRAYIGFETLVCHIHARDGGDLTQRELHSRRRVAVVGTLGLGRPLSPFQMRVVERITLGPRAIWKGRRRRGGACSNFAHRPSSGSANCVMSRLGRGGGLEASLSIPPCFRLTDPSSGSATHVA